jgi:exopolyphosphatase/guanosine-5'-triphosphate,3'-diphosphate pyrophosphatase
VTGDVEARLSFTGATRELSLSQGPYLVVDIGGGSTEFVLGSKEVLAARSVDIGCVRMTERHLRDDPPTTEQLTAARSDVRAAIGLAGETVPLRDASVLVGVAGTVTTVAAMALDLPSYDERRIHLASRRRGSRARRDAAPARDARGRSARRCRSCIPAASTSSVRVR